MAKPDKSEGVSAANQHPSNENTIAEDKHTPRGTSAGAVDGAPENHSVELDILTAPKRESEKWKQEKTTWGGLLEMVSGTPATKKECGNYVVGLFEKTSRGGRPTFYRKKDTVKSRGVLTLDADSAGAGFKADVGLLGVAAALHTTFSSTPDALRYRVLILLSQKVTPAEYRRLAEVVMHQIGVEQFDPGSVEAWRYMFRPSVAEGQTYDHAMFDGPALDVNATLKEWSPDMVVRHRQNEGKGTGRKRDQFQLPGAVGAFNRAYSIERAVEEFGLPYDAVGDRWLFRGSESGIPGLTLLADGLAYSHHSSDPANGTWGAFDLVRLHLFGELDEGEPDDTELIHLPSHKAMVEKAMGDPDVLAELGAVGDFPNLPTKKRAEREEKAGGREVVVIYDDGRRWAEQAVGRGRLSGVFLRGQELAVVVCEGEEGYIAPKEDGDHNGPTQLLALDPGRGGGTRLWAIMVQEHSFYNKNGKEVLFNTIPAQYAVNLGPRLPNVRPLHGVTDIPLVRSDGSLLMEPGYDEATGLYYVPTGDAPTVPDKPTREDVDAARDALLYLVVDFPFLTDDDRANWMAMLITPMMRLLFGGVVKGFLIDATDSGSGKTLLAQLLQHLYGAVFRGSWPRDNEEEVGKEIGTIFDTTTAPVVIFDNVRGVLQSPKVEAMLTSGTYSQRRLGSSTAIEGVNDRLWIWTGNNMKLGGDLPRRMVKMSIDPKVPDPELRSNFKESDLPGYVRKHRTKLLGAVLTLVRAWVLAGRPMPKDYTSSADVFASWRDAVTGVLHFAGVEGEFDSAKAREESESAEDLDWRELLEALEEAFGRETWTAADAADRLHGTDVWPAELLGKEIRPGFARSLGRWLSNRDGRFVGDLCVRSVDQGGHRASTLWKIVRHTKEG